MVVVMKPIYLTSHFPHTEVVFFGQIIDESGRKGISASRLYFPLKHDPIEFRFGEEVSRVSHISSDTCNFGKVMVDFKNIGIAGQRNLINKFLEDEEKTIDTLSIEGALIYEVSQSKRGYSLRVTPALSQAVELYSILRCKNRRALERIDNQVARYTILSLQNELDSLDPFDSKYCELSDKLDTAYRLLLKDIISESI